MTPTPIAELVDVRKRRGPDFALDVPRLEIRAGEVLCVLGPTGAGKSTLLSLLAATATADEGQVRIAGEALGARSAAIGLRRRITMVFQRPLMLSGTVRRNVEFGLRLRRSLAPAKVDAVAKRLGLARLMHRWAATLSGGETQLVAIARALVLRPSLLLLDEPTASLDAARVELVERVVREVVAETDMAVVWATHNLFQARRMADRAALLLDGRIIEEAPAETFFHRPSDERTAAFVEGRFIY
jgi:tungstate transport system ATP-binding protein